jgi:hypothetical protein
MAGEVFEKSSLKRLKSESGVYCLKTTALQIKEWLMPKNWN